jgi:hypothetical protein
MTKQHILDISTFVGGLAAIWFFGDLCDKNNYCFPVATIIIVLAAVGWIGYRWQQWQKQRRVQSDLNVPGGTVPVDSPFYVERPPAEKTCYDLIVKDNALIRIKAPRQMGKSSLMVRVLRHAEQHGHRSVCLSFQGADHAIFANLDQFLQWFCSNIANQLDLPDTLADRWQGVMGSKSKCTNYFEEYLLVQVTSHLVLGLDEVDLIFEHKDIAVDFFGLLRAWFEKGRNKEPWKRVSFVITHSQEVYIPLDMKQSPFNVGTAVDLPPFTQAQVVDLLRRYGLVWPEENIAKLMALVGGHPYLVQVAIYQLTHGQMSLDKLIKIASHEEGPYSDHLRRHRVNLEEHAELATAIKTIVASVDPIPVREVKEVFKLRSMGLVKVIDDQVMPLCELYRRYFGERL